MTFTYSSTPDLAVYTNNNYITVARSATAVQINLPVDAVFNSPPALTSVGLGYTTTGNPDFIEGDPDGPATVFTINTLFPSETFYLQVIEPTFAATNLPCSMNIELQDTMINSNPALAGRGVITYYIQKDDVWIRLGSISQGGLYTITGCNFDLGTYNIKAVYQVYEQVACTCGCGNCIGEGEVIFEAEYTDTVTISEYRPEFNLFYESQAQCITDSCCGGMIGIAVRVNLNFNTHKTTGTSTLTWQLFDMNEVQIGTDTVITIDNTDPDAIPTYFEFTPTLRADYKVIATLDNGCSACTQYVIVSTCDYLTLTKIVPGCNKYTISNCSSTFDHTYTIFDIEGVVVAPADRVLNRNSNTTFQLEDGIYTVVVYNDDDSIKATYIIIADCNVRACLTDTINKIICPPDGCKCEDPCKARYKVSRILPLMYMFYSYANKEYTMNNVYTVLDGDKILELQSVASILEKLQDFCDECGDAGDCGCGCS